MKSVSYGHLKKSLICVVMLACCISPLSAQYDKAAIEEVIKEAYVDGVFNTGYMLSVNQSFSDEFQSIGLENDTLRIETLNEWKQRINQRKAEGKYPATAQEKASIKYLNIEIVNTVANVKLELTLGKEVQSIDFLALYKFKGGWKIVNRTFHNFSEK